MTRPSSRLQRRLVAISAIAASVLGISAWAQKEAETSASPATQLAAACTTREAATTANTGQSANASAAPTSRSR